MMRSLGIALDSPFDRFTCCKIQWVSRWAFVETPRVGISEAQLLEEMARSNWIAFDTPLGWPTPYVDAINAYNQIGCWPAAATPERVFERETDRAARTELRRERGVELPAHRIPSARIATCARLISQHVERTGRQLNRVGVPVGTLSTGMDGPPDPPRPTGLVAPAGVTETWPRAALAMWGLPHAPYSPHGQDVDGTARRARGEVLDEIQRLTDPWLFMDSGARGQCHTSPDALDAFICALLACAVATDNTIRPYFEQRGAAQREGWLHLPVPDSLEGLAPAAV